MDDAEQLLRDIEQFVAKANMAETTFGARAVNNAHLVGRLRRGGAVTTRTLQRVRRFMAEFDSGSLKRAAPQVASAGDAA